MIFDSTKVSNLLLVDIFQITTVHQAPFSEDARQANKKGGLKGPYYWEIEIPGPNNEMGNEWGEQCQTKEIREVVASNDCTRLTDVVKLNWYHNHSFQNQPPLEDLSELCESPFSDFC